jgi:hypothetical protein
MAKGHKKMKVANWRILTLFFTAVGAFSYTYLETQNNLKVLKARYC